MFNKNVKVLITGGAGFIGVNLAAYLLEKGFKVTVIDNLSRKGSENNLKFLLKKYKSKKLRFEKIDIRDFPSIKKIVKENNTIFHLAGQVAVTTSIINPREDFESNALGTFNILEAVRQSGKKQIILFSSTNKVYGKMENIKVKENRLRYVLPDLPNGIDETFSVDFYSPYGCSNGAAEQYVKDYYRTYKIPTVVFRQSCIYGPRQMGVEDQGWVSHFAISALKRRETTIYGDGKQVRDILYIDDLINAYEKAVLNIDKSTGKIYNIGGGIKNSLSLLEYLNFLEKEIGKKIKVQYKDFRLGDQKVFISNNNKLKMELDWEPKVGAEDGIRRMIGWIREKNRLFS